MPDIRLLQKRLMASINNGHGDVVEIVDEDGNIVNEYEYDEWGNILSEKEEIENPIKYAGEYYDKESGHYYLRARYYDPTIGRFISEDSYKGSVTNPLSLNLYTYSWNNPVKYADLSGNDPITITIVWLGTIASSPDTQMDIEFICMDLANGDCISAGLDLIGMGLPGVTGVGKTTKTVVKKSGELIGDLLKKIDLQLFSKGTGKPNKIHHFLTNKSKKYAPKFKEIADKYGLDLDEWWNKKSLPHQGRHPYDYHNYMIKKAKEYDSIVNGDKELFLELFEEVKIMNYLEIIDSDEYKNPNEIICYADDNYESKYNIKHYDVNQGLLLKEYNEGITFYYDKKNGSKVTDYVSNNLGWFIISTKFKRILENIGVNNVQYIPIDIREKSTKDTITGYNIVNIVGLVDGLNLEESVYKILKVRGQEHISVTKPALDSNKLKGLHLARVKNCIFATFVSDILKNELETNNITGCDFLKVKAV